MKLASSFLILIVLGGCANPHLYPVCSYDGEEVRQKTIDQLKSALRTTLGGDRNVEIDQSPDRRWLIARVTEEDNIQIAKVWPRVGCLGDPSDSAGAKREADCVAYVRDFVENKNYFSFGNSRDAGGFDIYSQYSKGRAALYCQRSI